jgi:hypothetical protein
VSKSHAGRWIGDADEVLAGRTLNLAAGKLRFALQWLVAMRAVKFEFVCVHNLLPISAQNPGKKYIKTFPILFADKSRLIW